MAKADNLSQFIFKTNAMFDRADAYLENIGHEFIMAAAERLIRTTPGPGLQDDQTEYIATGRLRGGWTFGLNPPSSVSRDTGGPYEDRGTALLANIRLQVFATPLQDISFLWNEVAYAYYVHEGLGNHIKIGKRPWIASVGDQGYDLLVIARSRAKGQP